MEAKKGNIGVTTENIFPVIKQFLYSDHDIFLREIVSNAVDACQKLKTIDPAQAEGLKVNVKVDKEAGTLTVSDNGVGMTAEEVEKYINQIAFSGANDFLEKYKDNAAGIIGHFGLGFYSAFMVSKQVDILTKSYQKDAKAVRWTCDGSQEFTMEETEKDSVGTDIVMHLDDESKEFLEEHTITSLLHKYCQFLPVPVAFGKKKEWKTDKDGKNGHYEETAEDNVVNDTTPLWTKKPSDLKDEDYKKFYQQLYPMANEPLFWIHLNVDFPFHLTGVLYFPKVTNQFELQKNKIQLYCNQVFVTDSVEGVVPEFLTLLHGVIDSPDIPLNVSRSYLQSDKNVKKISSYITKKVSDKLQSLFKNDRKDFEQKWDDIKIFIHYGMLSEEDFYDKAQKFALLKDTEGKYFTYEEYKTLIQGEQTDKDGNLIYLYAQNAQEQYSFVEAAKQKGYSVLLMDGELDTALLGLLEQKQEKSRFMRVDADIISRLINKEQVAGSKEQEDAGKDKTPSPLEEAFKAVVPKEDEKVNFNIELQALGETAAPVVITQSEWMRRMKDMARIQPGMAFYGQMPDSYNVVVNTDHPLVKKVEGSMEQVAGSKEQVAGDDKEQVAGGDKEQVNNLAKQLIDLALLQNGMLKGEALSQFVARSIELL